MGTPADLDSFVTAYEQIAKVAPSASTAPFHLPDTIIAGFGPADPNLLFRLVMACVILHRQGRSEQAIAAARAACKIPADNAQLALCLAQLSYLAGDFARSRKLIKTHSGHAANPNWMLLDSAVALHQGNITKARMKAVDYANSRPLVQLPNHQNPVPTLCILRDRPQVINDPFEIRRMHIGGNLISQYISRFPQAFNVISLLADAETASRAQETAPVPDILVSNVVEGEVLGDPSLRKALRDAANRWGMKCINGPEAAYHTARDKIQELFADESDILAPRTLFYRFEPETAIPNKIKRVEGDFDLPVIIRPPFFQDGVGMTLCHSTTELAAAIETLDNDFFVISFIDNRREGKFYRKIRAAWIADKLHLVRMDHGDHWMLHGHRNKPHRIEFFRNHPQFLDEEISVCREPESYLGDRAMRALKTIRSKMDLDYFGIDFDVMPDGQLLLFEANAAMNMLNKPNVKLQHPEFAEKALLEDFQKLLIEHAKRSQNR